ncbi:MAG: hypothetical protein IPK16_22530 [Anaerolineales bacterium]|nr:hypothetical protein [Anaerolineales bacterium]
MVIIILSWMGTPYYAVQGAPAVEIVQELMPEEGAGLVREIGYDGLPIGVYDTREHPVTEDAEFNEVLHEFEAAIKHFGETDASFNEPYGILTVSQEQPGLKRINWELFWLSPDGIEENFQRFFFIHENALYWEQYQTKDFGYLREGQPAAGE